jgi:hypothetical protein
MYEYRGIAVIDGNLTQLNELAAEGWRVVTHLPGHRSLDQYLLGREKPPEYPQPPFDIGKWVEGRGGEDALELSRHQGTDCRGTHLV